jgi:SAM-dependent methyltransferase
MAMKDRLASPDVPPHIPPWSYTRLRERPAGMDHLSTEDLGWEFIRRMATEVRLDDDRNLVELGFDIRCILDVITDLHWNRYSRTCCRNNLAGVAPLLARVRAGRGPNAHVALADIGCGSWNPLGIGFLSLVLGADEALAFDREAPQYPARAVWVLTHLAAAAIIDPASVFPDEPRPTPCQVLERLSNFDLTLVSRGDSEGIDSERLRFQQGSATSLGVPDGAFDVTRSAAFLEHVEDVDGVVAELARVTRRGGFGLHHIDAVDHRIYASSLYTGLSYLEDSTPGEVVDTRLRGPGGIVQNRVRPHEWVRRFEAHGFHVESFVPMRPTAVDDAARARFVEPYRSMPVEQLRYTAGDYLMVRI